MMVEKEILNKITKFNAKLIIIPQDNNTIAFGIISFT